MICKSHWKWTDTVLVDIFVIHSVVKGYFKIEDILRMFDRFNQHRFQSPKLSKLIAEMALHGWLKLWIWLPM